MFNIKLANHIFTVYNRFSHVEQLCRDYRTDSEGVPISISNDELMFEAKNNADHSAGYFESLAVYRKICTLLLKDNILLFHASALSVDKKAYLFTAPSGTGKSTHVQMWKKRFQDRVTIINDDKPLLLVKKGHITVFGTPYCGKEGLNTNISAPAAGIVILHQDKSNTIKPITASQAYPILFGQTFRPKDKDLIIRVMDLVEQLTTLPVYSMGCTVSIEAAELAYKTLTKQENHFGE